MQSALRTASYALRAGCLLHVFHHSVYEITESSGESMLPTLSNANDYVHVSKLHALGRGCNFGDVVVAAKPTQPSQRVCKRITGMPRDLVRVDPTNPLSHDVVEVPDGHVWVTGDNLACSIDSRTYGPLPMGLIKGKVVAAQRGWKVRRIE